MAFHQLIHHDSVQMGPYDLYAVGHRFTLFCVTASYSYSSQSAIQGLPRGPL